MNVINKIKNMGHIPNENRTYDEFIKNVESHHKYEILSSKKAELYFKSCLKSFNETKDYDILLQNGFKIEVKFIGTFDEYDTVNIECFRNEPSGILTTKSDYYIITNSVIYYLIKTDELLKICEICEIKKLKYSFCYIIPKKLFIASSLVI
jgi:mRNA-degrading endonuclease HigB of HigAB toxin-antitoxin module